MSIAGIGSALGAISSMVNTGTALGQNAGFSVSDTTERQQSIADQKRLSAEGREDTLLAAQLKNEQERSKAIAEMSHVGPNAISKNAETMAR